jgi:hypothetical protein
VRVTVAELPAGLLVVAEAGLKVSAAAAGGGGVTGLLPPPPPPPQPAITPRTKQERTCATRAAALPAIRFTGDPTLVFCKVAPLATAFQTNVMCARGCVVRDDDTAPLVQSSTVCRCTPTRSSVWGTAPLSARPLLFLVTARLDPVICADRRPATFARSWAIGSNSTWVNGGNSLPRFSRSRRNRSSVTGSRSVQRDFLLDRGVVQREAAALSDRLSITG